MSEVASHELRNDTAGVLRRVQDGWFRCDGPEKGSLPRAELVRRLAVSRADSGLRDDLARLAGDTTDDLGPVR